MEPEYIYRYEVDLPEEYHKEYGRRVGIFHVPDDLVADWDRDLSIENKYVNFILDIGLVLRSPDLRKYPHRTGGFMSFFTEDGADYFNTKINGLQSIVDECPYGCKWHETIFDISMDEFNYYHPVYEDQYQKIYYAADIFYIVRNILRKKGKDVTRYHFSERSNGD